MARSTREAGYLAEGLERPRRAPLGLEDVEADVSAAKVHVRVEDLCQEPRCWLRRVQNRKLVCGATWLPGGRVALLGQPLEGASSRERRTGAMGYCSEMWRIRLNEPPSYGVPDGPSTSACHFIMFSSSGFNLDIGPQAGRL